MKTAAILLVNSTLLAELLQLPPGAEIELIDKDIDQPDLFKVRIIGAGFPVKDGDVIPSARGLCRGDEWIPNAAIDWGLPSHALSFVADPNVPPGKAEFNVAGQVVGEIVNIGTAKA